ncbi:MAG: DUF4249 domain-containing protein [Prolixibacteraceae bacterium]|nr:DUF4249 domain-containing protein [Prolixibacteraceae bacterium]
MKKVIIIGIALLMFLSCYTEFDLSNEVDDTGPVVSAFIANDSLIKVYLYKVIGADDAPQRIDITDATVKLFENGVAVENLKLDFNTGVNSVYDTIYFYTSLNTTACAGKTYRIEITTFEREFITSETYIPEPVEILSVDTSSIFIIDTLSNSYSEESYLWVSFKDPPEKNFYRLTIKGRYGNNIGNDTIKIWNRVITSFNKNNSVFSYFGEDEENKILNLGRNNFQIFNDNTFNGQGYEIELYNKSSSDVSYSPEKGEFTQYIIELHSITEEGYYYLRSVDLQSQTMRDLTEPVLPFTNIENGVGIFTGYSASQKIITLGEYPVEGVVYK